MKNILRSSLLICILAFGVAGCRSRQAQVVDSAPTEEVTPQWSNVRMPVRLDVTEPVNLSVNGTATMVRGEYIYMSFRFMGFEVAQVYVNPDEFDFVIKPQKTWLQEPMGDRLTSRNTDFLTVQEAMLGNPMALEAIVPKSVSLKRSGTATVPEFSIHTKLSGMAVDLTVSWNLNEARWNVERPAAFTAPGSGYSKMTLKKATNLLGK